MHHPDEALLMDYATGAMSEAESVVIATHAALCPRCRMIIAEMEAAGGELFEDLEPVAMASDSLDTMMSRLIDEPFSVDARTPLASPADFTGMTSQPGVPRPLRDYLPADLENLPWRQLMRGLAEVPLQIGSDERIKAKLMRVDAGTAMPQHTHEGEELTLVLQGGFRDETGHYRRGDIAIHGHSVDHQPVADEDGTCYCLAVTTAPLKLTGKIGRLLNPFVRF